MKILTATRLREVLSYDPETGVFRWLVSPNRRIPVGSAAGTTPRADKDRGMVYQYIKIDGQQYRAHRLAWLYVYDEWPEGEVDHRNRNPSDNRISNLRVATPAQNRQNRSTPFRNSPSGLLGVHPSGRRWTAHIGVGGRQQRLGTFDTPAEAHAAYLKAKAALHPFWAGV